MKPKLGGGLHYKYLLWIYVGLAGMIEVYAVRRSVV